MKTRAMGRACTARDTEKESSYAVIEQHRRSHPGPARQLSQGIPELGGYEVRREHLAQLSPYLTGHVERFGDYVVDLESIPRR